MSRIAEWSGANLEASRRRRPPRFGLGSVLPVHKAHRSAEEVFWTGNPGCTADGGPWATVCNAGGVCVAANALRGNGTEAHSLHPSALLRVLRASITRCRNTGTPGLPADGFAFSACSCSVRFRALSCFSRLIYSRAARASGWPKVLVEPPPPVCDNVART
jgi:hypothetical protein